MVKIQGYDKTGGENLSALKDITITEDSSKKKAGIDINIHSKSSGIDLSDDIRFNKLLQLQDSILKELRILNSYQEIITDDLIKENEVERW